MQCIKERPNLFLQIQPLGPPPVQKWSSKRGLTPAWWLQQPAGKYEELWDSQCQDCFSDSPTQSAETLLGSGEDLVWHVRVRLAGLPHDSFIPSPAVTWLAQEAEGNSADFWWKRVLCFALLASLDVVWTQKSLYYGLLTSSEGEY